MSFISPSANFDANGPKTEIYKTSKDSLLIDFKSNRYVSNADFVFTLVDELENPQHKTERFTVVLEDK